MSKEKQISLLIDDALKRNQKRMESFTKHKAEIDKGFKRILNSF